VTEIHPPSSATHEAIDAWRKLSGNTPSTIASEILKNDKKTTICRLRIQGKDAERKVIAKRAAVKSIEREAIIHSDVLGKIPISSVEVYGTLVEDDDDFGWLFLEDAGEQRWTADSADHRTLAASWLAAMHAGAHWNTAAQALQRRGPKWYLKRLGNAQSRITLALPNVARNSERIGSLESLLTRLQIIEANWDTLASFCSGFPETLVHCDFSPKNLRVRMRDGILELFPLDWETAGWAAPAIDISEEIDVDTYLRDIQSTWPQITRGDWLELRSYGRIFRALAAVEWASEDLEGVWLRRPINYLETYDEWLAQALSKLGWSVRA
jgi:aminoglycoside/choline kinase family phosphotransferase